MRERERGRGIEGGRESVRRGGREGGREGERESESESERGSEREREKECVFVCGGEREDLHIVLLRTVVLELVLRLVQASGFSAWPHVKRCRVHLASSAVAFSHQSLMNLT